MRLKELAKKQNLSYRKMAELFGVSHDTAQRWCVGKSLPDAMQLADLADHFGVSMDWLIGRPSEANLSEPESQAVKMVRARGLTTDQVIRLLSQPTADTHIHSQPPRLGSTRCHDSSGSNDQSQPNHKRANREDTPVR